MLRVLRHLAQVIAIALVAATSSAQIAPLFEHEIAVRVASATLQNDGLRERTLFQYLVAVKDASSVQVRFGRTRLTEGTMLRITSLTDGATQHHRAITLEQWNYRSAWFNGPLVLVELVAAPGSGPSHVTIDAAAVHWSAGADRSICGPTDDRVLSYDDRSARAIPIGCTAWLIDDPNHTFLTAGHCAGGGTSDISTVEFNVPLSNSDGSIQHPGPEDQYATDAESFQSGYSGIGDDWSYFGCFPNTETGMTPFQAQGEFHILADAAPPVSGQDITITGYGVVYSPTSPTWNQVQKTHTGPYDTLDGTAIAYQTDTSGGNSGSPVLNEDTGEAIGIHTNGGCGGGGGENWGCAIHNSGLQYALANPQGVCIPNTLHFDYPNGIPSEVLPGTSTELLFSVTAGDETPVPETIEVRMTIDEVQENLDVTALGDDLYTATIPALECQQDVTFWLRAVGDGGTVVYDPPGAPDDDYEIGVGVLVEVTLLEEGFGLGIPGSWSTSGLWHASNACGPSGSCDGGEWAYFGIDGQCDYDTGDTETGTLSTPPISLDGVHGNLILSYCSALETENFSSYDLAEVRINGVAVDDVSESPGWQQREVTFNPGGADSIVIEWVFDTVDGVYNNYRGWHIDGITVVAASVDCDPVDTCPADIDGSGSVDVADVLAVIADWGDDDSDADVNDDGTVDVNDLLAVIGAWGACP